MIPRLSCVAYRLPLQRPWRSAHGLRTERRGWLVRAELGGHAGYGDCAPLPEAGTESAATAQRRLEDWCRQAASLSLEQQLAMLAGPIDSPAGSAARGSPPGTAGARSGTGRSTPAGALADTLADTLADKLAGAAAVPRAALASATPAADAALETALLDLDARLHGHTLRARLLQHADSPSPAPPLSAIRVNAALGAATEQQPEALAAAIAGGFDVLKLKVGVAPLADELAALQTLCDRLPLAVRLRLDANQAWSPAEAQQLVQALEPLGERIESLEEPLRADAEVPRRDAALQALQAQAAFSIALDESLPGRPWPLAPDELPVRRLVLKPAVLGGLRSTMALAQAVEAAGREVVITSLIESAAGLWASAQLAAATGSPLAHGLATSDWLARDLGAAPAIAQGRLGLTASAGSGFSPSRSTLSRFA